MNRPMNNVSRALQAAVMLLAIILLAMTVSQATLAEGQTVLIVYGDEDAGNTENLHADWAFRLNRTESCVIWIFWRKSTGMQNAWFR